MVALRAFATWWCWLAPVVLACSASTSNGRVDSHPRRSLDLCFVSGDLLNGGGVLHVVVRQTSAVDFEKVTYEDIVTTLSQRDSETLDWTQILPARATVRSVNLESLEEGGVPSKDGSVGVYFLFANREEPWKALVDAETDSVSFTLGSNRIEHKDQQRWRCKP